MITRLGLNEINSVLGKSLKTVSKTIHKPSPISLCGEQVLPEMNLTSKRVKMLNLYNNRKIKDYLFNFSSNGEIHVTQRVHGSADLDFLEHIKNKTYSKPHTVPAGTYPRTPQAIAQSNELAKNIITENDKIPNGFRYCGADARFDSTGRNISRFRNGNQEIIVVDRNLDQKLNKTIGAFKNRIQGKNLSEESKINELMKFVDEVFSVEKSGSATEKLVANMDSSNQVEVLFGDIINSGAGVCRHRSLLTKILGDEIGLKTRLVQGYYGKGGHAWNEIITKNKKTYLFDAMHRNVFDISNPDKLLAPQTFGYRITNPKDPDKIVQKYLNPKSKVRNIYFYLTNKAKINTNAGSFIPTSHGYVISPISDLILVNGKRINEPVNVSTGDWVQIKDLGFQII